MDTGPVVEVTHNEREKQYEARINGEIVGLAVYRESGGKLVFDHTETNPDMQGRGIAARVVRTALDDARQQGKQIVPACSYVDAFVRRHPEYADLVAP